MAVEYRRHPQHPLELRVLREWVKDAQSILEIGSRFGDNLVFLAVSMGGNRLVSVDLPGAEGNIEADFVRLELKNNCKKLRDAGFQVDLILGDSHTIDMFNRVAELAPFDVVMIDGDHTYEGVKQDWKMYGSFGKQVIFHDINPVNGLGVSEFWSEMKEEWAETGEYEFEEYIGHNSKMGIGRVWTQTDK